MTTTFHLMPACADCRARKRYLRDAVVGTDQADDKNSSLDR
jgi:hypothetical protein